MSEILEVVINVAIIGCCLFYMQPEQDKFAVMYMGKIWTERQVGLKMYNELVVIIKTH